MHIYTTEDLDQQIQQTYLDKSRTNIYPIVFTVVLMLLLIKIESKSIVPAIKTILTLKLIDEY